MFDTLCGFHRSVDSAELLKNRYFCRRRAVLNMCDMELGCDFNKQSENLLVAEVDIFAQFLAFRKGK